MTNENRYGQNLGVVQKSCRGNGVRECNIFFKWLKKQEFRISVKEKNG